MKRWIAMLLAIFLFTGCQADKHRLDPFLSLRSALQTKGCSFDAVITADYGDKTYSFRLACTAEKDGTVQFSVREPESIRDICGMISPEGGKLTFDDTALAFELLADGLLSPVSGPYILMKALLGGYIQSAGADGEYLRATIKDSYEDDAFTLDVWLDRDNVPVQADILWKNRRILTIRVEKFQLR